MMVWDAAGTLVKVSGHDGHLTNAGAQSDTPPDVVYLSSDPDRTTRRAP